MSLCDNIRSAPELRPRLGFCVEYMPKKQMYRVDDGNRFFTAAARDFADLSRSDTAQITRRFDVYGHVYVLWIAAPDQSSPVYMSRVPDALWRYTI